MPCPNGHAIEDGDQFCGSCGAPTTPPVEAEPACPAGHDNPPGNLFCGTCGQKTATSRAAALPTNKQPSSLRKGRNLAFVGVLALLSVMAIVLVVTRSGGPSDDDRVEASYERYDDVTTTTESIEDICAYELSAWLEIATGRNGGSLRDIGAQFGIHSPEYQIVQNGWSTFNQNLYQVGRNEASSRAFSAIEQGCRNLGASYLPGQVPPG